MLRGQLLNYFCLFVRGLAWMFFWIIPILFWFCVVFIPVVHSLDCVLSQSTNSLQHKMEGDWLGVGSKEVREYLPDCYNIIPVMLCVLWRSTFIVTLNQKAWSLHHRESCHLLITLFGWCSRWEPTAHQKPHQARTLPTFLRHETRYHWETRFRRATCGSRAAKHQSVTEQSCIRGLQKWLRERGGSLSLCDLWVSSLHLAEMPTDWPKIK